MLLASTSSGEGLPSPHFPRHLEWGSGVNCPAPGRCEVSGVTLGHISLEPPIRAFSPLGASPVQDRTSMRQSPVERAAGRQALPCFGRLEGATASDPTPTPKTAALAQLLPGVPVEICQLVGGPDAWAGHVPRCHGPGLSGCPWAPVAAEMGRRVAQGVLPRVGGPGLDPAACGLPGIPDSLLLVRCQGEGLLSRELQSSSFHLRWTRG